MIVQVVFDLPLEGPFDYAVPADLEGQVAPGMRAEVTLGFRKTIGIITAVLNSATVDKNLKHLRSLKDTAPVLDTHQMALGAAMSAYYGCSLGDALFTILRGSLEHEVSGTAIKRQAAVQPVLHLCTTADYEKVIIGLCLDSVGKRQKTLILAPDQFSLLVIDGFLKRQFSQDDYVIGMRSTVFRSLADIGLVIMVDEDNSSFKQEQTPMYETRDVLLMRAKHEKVEVAFVNSAPTVELMHLVQTKAVALKDYPAAPRPSPQVVDLNNYKILTKGLLSPAVLNVLESNLKKKQKTILVFNHRGAFAMTRCVECDLVLKCTRCESPMTFSRTEKKYVCRYCSFTLPGDINCPKCKKPSWKSFGLGVEQLQKALQDKFPVARITSFERGSVQLEDGDIMIGTSALLRFKTKIKASLVAFLDMDSELNRMDMRSCFRTWSLVEHLRAMAKDQLLVQTRQPDHYVMQALAKDKREIFYQEDMKIRRELGFAPFAHQISVHLRAKDQKSVEVLARELHQLLAKICPKQVQLSAPAPDLVAHKRGQYRLNILLQGSDVIGMISLIKEALSKLKRKSKVFVTINTD